MDNITETAGTVSHADYLSALDLSSKVALNCQRKLSAAIFSGRFSGGLTMPYDVNRKHGIYRVYICGCNGRLSFSHISDTYKFLL